MKLKLAANTLYQTTGKIISSGCSFLITILLAKKFGPEGYGDFEKITSFVALFYLAVDFGINAIALSQIKKEPEKKSEIYNLVLGTRIILGLFLIFLCLAVLSFLPASTTQGFTPLARIGIIFASITILFQGITIANNLLFQEALQYQKSIIASSLAYLIFLGLIYGLIKTELPILFAIIIYVAFFIIYGFFSLFFAKTLVTKVKPIFNLQKILSLLKLSLPLGITLIFNVIYFRSDIILLSFLRSTREVAYYGLAYRFFEFALVFPTFFNNALYPILLDAKKNGKDAVAHLFYLSGGFLFGVSLVGLLVLYFLAPWLIGLTGPAFNESVLSLRILIIALPVFYLTSLLMWVMIAYNRQKILAYIYGSTMIINIALNIYFIPRFGYLASSIITGVTEALVLIFLLIALRKEFSYNPLYKFVKPDIRN